VVILEMNHVPLHQSTSPERINTISGLPEKTAGKAADETLSVSPETFLFKPTW